MKTLRLLPPFFLCLFGLLCLAGSARAEDWKQVEGPLFAHAECTGRAYGENHYNWKVTFRNQGNRSLKVLVTVYARNPSTDEWRLEGAPRFGIELDPNDERPMYLSFPNNDTVQYQYRIVYR